MIMCQKLSVKYAWKFQHVYTYYAVQKKQQEQEFLTGRTLT